MSYGATLRAASRGTPRMAAFRVKRVLRNSLARRSPRAYAYYVDRVAASVPPLELSRRTLDASLTDLARSVVVFYHDEYIDAIDDAANGRFTFYGKGVDFGNVENVDWHHQIDEESDFHLWRMKLAHMGFACPMLSAGNDLHWNAVGSMIDTFRANADFGVPNCFSSYWFPYSVSHRILAILSGYVLALQTRDLPQNLRTEIEAFLRWNVGFLLANVEHELRNNHVERNLAALCLYFSCVSSSPARRSRGLDREVRKIMHACVLSDGLTVERSAMYQGLTVMALKVFSMAVCLSMETRCVAAELHTKAVRAWSLMTHPDGQIALFNDSWIGEVPQAGQIKQHHNFASVELLPDAGYARFQAGAVFALMDAGPIGPRWNPGHGHADFLSLEVDVASKRFVVDPGTFQYSTGPRRAFERSASSHNGPIRTGLEPVEYTGCFRVGAMSEARFVARDASGESEGVSGRLELRDGTMLERKVELLPDTFRIVDSWFGGASGAFVRLTVPGAWLRGQHNAWSICFSEGDTRVELSLIEGRVAGIEMSEWSSRYLESQQATVIILEPRFLSKDLSRLKWEVRAIA